MEVSGGNRFLAQTVYSLMRRGRGNRITPRQIVFLLRGEQSLGGLDGGLVPQLVPGNL